MDFNLSREHQLIRKMMAEFTEKEVKPIAAETDRTCEYPRENIEKLFNLGVMGMCVPKEYGGAGADPLASAICIEELSKQCASTGDIVATHNGLCCDPVMTYGTPEQKAKYLPMLTTGHHVGAFALTEPNAGSDASKGQTEAKLEGDHYVMNGSKIFITNGYVADVFVVFAMTDKSKGTKGISAFIGRAASPASPWASMRKSWAFTVHLLRRSCSRIASSPRRISWAQRARAFPSLWPRWTAAALASRPRPWALPRARFKRPSTTPRAASSSASLFLSSKTRSSPWPTWSWAVRRVAC